MAMDWDEERPKPQPDLLLGRDLSTLSVEELRDYLAALDAERQRVEATLSAKTASQEAANAFFKR